MRMKIDAVTGVLIVLFIAAYILVGQGMLNLGPYSPTLLVLIFFTLFTFYDQFKRPHLERNYIFIFVMVSLFLGAGLGF